MQEIITLILANAGTAAWSAGSATVALVVNKLWVSRSVKKAAVREDFKVVTDSLFTELASLRKQVDEYKEDSDKCEAKYNDLQTKFIEFKGKHNELELRYQIQININKKISEDIKKLEIEIQSHMEKEKPVIDESTVEQGFSLRAPKNSPER